jgi:hypothetical protein
MSVCSTLRLLATITTLLALTFTLLNDWPSCC